MMKKTTFWGFFFSTDGAKIPSFSFIPLFHRFCNTNKCKFAVSLFPRARITGVLHFSLSQVSQLLAYNAVNDSVIDFLLFSLTVWEPLFLKKSFRGVEVVWRMCGENPPKMRREKKLVWHLWQQKTTSLLEGARILVCACVCVPMRVASLEDSFRCCTTVASHSMDKVVGQWQIISIPCCFARWRYQIRGRL